MTKTRVLAPGVSARDARQERGVVGSKPLTGGVGEAETDAGVEPDEPVGSPAHAEARRRGRLAAAVAWANRKWGPGHRWLGLVCGDCGHRWIGVVPVAANAGDAPCPECGARNTKEAREGGDE